MIPLLRTLVILPVEPSSNLLTPALGLFSDLFRQQEHKQYTDNCVGKTPIHIKNLNLKCLLKRTIEKQAVYLPTSKVPPVKRRACSTKPYSKVKETWAALLRQHADGGSWLEGISVGVCGASAKNTHMHMFMVCSIEGHRDPVSLAYTGLPG